MNNYYRILKRTLLLLILISGLISAYGQMRTVKGKIIAQDDGSAIPGVNILVKGTTSGAVTDVDGLYSLSVDANSVLVISVIGYATQEVPVEEKSTIDIVMVPDVTNLEEIVVVGYGTQLKKEITGSVQTISERELKDLPVAQITQKIQGRLAGV